MKTNHVTKALASLFLLALGHIQGQEPPPGGITLIEGNSFNSFKLYSGTAAATKREKNISGQPFKKIVELSTRKETSNFWSAEYSAPLDQPVKKNGVALMRFYLRCTSTENPDGTGVVQVYCQKASPDWDKSLSRRIVIGGHWREYLIPLAFSGSYQPREAMVAFGLGAGKPQTLQLSGIQLLYYGNNKTVDELPKTRETYVGRELDAQWRVQAQKRINEIRKGVFVVQVTDASGLPVRKATVQVEQIRHSFQFGSAVALWHLVSHTEENKVYQQKFLGLFNAGGPENRPQVATLARGLGNEQIRERYRPGRTTVDGTKQNPCKGTCPRLA